MNGENLIGFESGKDLDDPTWPADLQLLNPVMCPQAKMDSGVAGGSVAGAGGGMVVNR